jgi:hypothetical protein
MIKRPTFSSHLLGQVAEMLLNSTALFAIYPLIEEFGSAG